MKSLKLNKYLNLKFSSKLNQSFSVTNQGRDFSSDFREASKEESALIKKLLLTFLSKNTRFHNTFFAENQATLYLYKESI